MRLFSIEHCFDESVDVVEGDFFEFCVVQHLQQVLEHSLVGVDDIVFELGVEAVDSVG